MLVVARQRTLTNERNSFPKMVLEDFHSVGVTRTPQQLGQYVSKVKDARARGCPELAGYTPPLFLEASWWVETMLNAFRHMRPGRAASDGITHEPLRAGELPATILYGQLRYLACLAWRATGVR